MAIPTSRYPIFLLLAIASGIAHADAKISVIPENPLQNEAVYVRVQASGDLLNSSNFHKHLSYVIAADTVDFRVVSGGNTIIPTGIR